MPQRESWSTCGRIFFLFGSCKKRVVATRKKLCRIIFSELQLFTEISNILYQIASASNQKFSINQETRATLGASVLHIPKCAPLLALQTTALTSKVHKLVWRQHFHYQSQIYSEFRNSHMAYSKEFSIRRQHNSSSSPHGTDTAESGCLNKPPSYVQAEHV